MYKEWEGGRSYQAWLDRESKIGVQKSVNEQNRAKGAKKGD